MGDEIIVYRGIWIREEELNYFLSGHPILPNGVESEDELTMLLEQAIQNFGSLRHAAIHHLTGATGVKPNVPGKPIFTFWTRRKDIALQLLKESYGSYDATIPLLLKALVSRGPRVIIASEEGIYGEQIADGLDYTFEDFAPEDEVFIALPISKYEVERVTNLDLDRFDQS